MATRLSSEQLDRYRREGYLRITDAVFPADRFAALQSYFTELQERWATVTGLTSEHMDKTHFWDPRLFDWLCDDAVLDIVEDIVGPDIVLFTSHFIAKPAGSGKRVPWHEDSAYWRRIWDPMDVVTVWLAIDPSTRANGCMQVIPGSQVNGYSDYEEVEDSEGNVFNTRIRADQVDESKAVHLELEPGQCSLHHARCIHGSEPNTSALPRCGLTMRYISAKAKWLADPDEWLSRQHHRNYLVRGQAHHDCAFGEIGAINHDWLAVNGWQDLAAQPAR